MWCRSQEQHQWHLLLLPARSIDTIGGANYIIRYLDGLTNKGTLHQLTEAMLQEMFGNKTTWIALISDDDTSAASNAMRYFWNG